MAQDHFHHKFKRMIGLNFLKLKLFFLVFCLGVFSLAQEGRFGPEWTFTKHRTVKNPFGDLLFEFINRRFI